MYKWIIAIGVWVQMQLVFRYLEAINQSISALVFAGNWFRYLMLDGKNEHLCASVRWMGIVHPIGYSFTLMLHFSWTTSYCTCLSRRKRWIGRLTSGGIVSLLRPSSRWRTRTWRRFAHSTTIDAETIWCCFCSYPSLLCGRFLIHLDTEGCYRRLLWEWSTVARTLNACQE